MNQQTTVTPVNPDTASTARTMNLLVQRNKKDCSDIVFKVVLCVLQCYFYVFAMVYWRSDPYPKNHIYLTAQTLTLVMIQNILGLLHFFGKYPDSHKFTKVVNVFNWLGFALGFLVFVFYWSVLSGNISGKTQAEFHVNNVQIHICSCFFGMLPILLTRSTWSHWYPLTITIPFGIYYAIFMWVYVEAAGKPIYNVMDYKTIWTLLYNLAALVLIIIGTYTGFGLHRLQESRFLKIERERSASYNKAPMTITANQNGGINQATRQA